MKKSVKISAACIAIAVIAVCFLVWSFSLAKSETPLDHPGSKWMSEDGGIVFEVFPPADDSHSRGDAVGTLTSQDGTVFDILLRVSHNSTLCVQDPENEYTYEMWRIKKFSEDGFTAEVEILDSRYAFHEKAAKIVFNRVDEN